MSARVPHRPTNVSLSQVKSGLVPLGADTWQPLVDNTNYLHGRGGQLICAYDPVYLLSTTGSAFTFRHKVSRRHNASHLLWTITLQTHEDGNCLATLTSSLGGTVDFSMGQTGIHTARLVEAVPSRQTGAQDLDMTIELDTSSSVLARVRGISCVEIPRYELAVDETEYGVNPNSLRASTTVLDDTAKSVGGALTAVQNAGAHRGAFLHWSVPIAVSTSDASYIAFFDGAPALLQRKLFDGDTVRSVTCYVYGSGTGDVRFTMDNGDSAVVSFSGVGSNTWLSETLDVDVEDPSQDDGNSGDDNITIEWGNQGTIISVLAIAIIANS